MSREEQFDFYWKEIFTGLAYNPIEFNTYRFDQSMSLPSKFNKLYEMFKQLALNNQQVMDYLKEFVETFEIKMETTVTDVLNVWLDDGKLAEIVRLAINEEVITARTSKTATYTNLKERLDTSDDNQEKINNKVGELQTTLIDDIKEIQKEITNIGLELSNKASLKSNISFTVGVGGDFSNITDAIKKITEYKQVYSSDLTFDITILSGYIVKEQLLFTNIDLSMITIKSIDPIVTIDATDFNSVFGSELSYPFIGARNAKAPNIDVLFSMTNSIDKNDGLYLQSTSSCNVLPNKGIMNSGGFGIRAFDNSSLSARMAIFKDSNGRGCMISQGSRLSAPFIDLSGSKGRNGFRAYRNCTASLEGANISNCGETAVRISEGCIVDIKNSNLSNAGVIDSEGNSNGMTVFGASVVNAQNCNFSGAKLTGLVVSGGSTVAADFSSNFSNCGGRGIDCYGNSRVMANSAIINGTVGEAIRASSNSTIECASSDITNCRNSVACLSEYGAIIYASSVNGNNNNLSFHATNGGKIIGNSITANSSTIGFRCGFNGEIIIKDSEATLCSNKAVEVSTGSKFVGSSCDFTKGVNYGVHVYRDSEASLFASNCMRETSETDTDIVCTTGSIIKASGANGGTNITPNLITTEGLIIK